MIGPTAMVRGISYGEVNWRQGVLATEYTKKAFGLKAVFRYKRNKWILELSFPLSDILEKPIKPGDDIYANFMRVRNPVLSGERPFGIDTWVAYTTVKMLTVWQKFIWQSNYYGSVTAGVFGSSRWISGGTEAAA